MKVIEFENIRLKIGNNLILDDVSFDINEGDIYGLIGHNGAGKTSLIRVLLGLTTTYKGKLRIFSDPKPSHQRIRIGSVIDSLNVDHRITAAQYIHRNCALTGHTSKKFEEQLLAKVGLSDTGNKKINNFSLGMKRRLLIAGALACQPKLMVMDEPFNGIDAEGMADLRLMLQQLSSEGITVLVTSHNIPELLKLSNKFGVMHKGKFICEITESDLSQTHKSKTVFSTSVPQKIVYEIKKLFPTIECYANAPGEISVFHEFDEISLKQLNSTIKDNAITDVHVSTMSEEEILLWKMNGHIT